MRPHIDLRTVIETMQPAALAELLERLHLFAAALLRMHGPRARHYAYTDEELVSEAFTRGLEGNRNCPEDVPVLTFLIWTIKSIVSHEAHRHEHELGRVSIDHHDDESEPCQVPSGENIEDEILAHAVLEEFKAWLKGDDELREYVEMRVEDDLSSTAEELAAEKGIPVSKIRNLNRRLARRRAQWNPR